MPYKDDCELKYSKRRNFKWKCFEGS
jgi:hypothetical protein